MFYRILKAIIKPVFHLLFRIKTVHKERLKVKGPLIIVANHRSDMDPFFVHFAVRPKVYIMSKAELFRIPLLRTIVRGLGAYPVQRGKGDLGALQTTERLLNEGKIVAIFPEGTRTREREMLPFQHGAAMVAMRTGVPVLPLYFSRTLRPLRRTRLVVGEQIDLQNLAGDDFSNAATVRMATNLLYYKLQRLQEEAERG